MGVTGRWIRELVLTAVALMMGFGLMPVLIFYAGSFSLGRYDGASVRRLYESIYHGLAEGSIAAWAVALGPYGFYLFFKALRLWWRVSARLA